MIPAIGPEAERFSREESKTPRDLSELSKSLEQLRQKEKIGNFFQRLERSEIAPQLKELMDGYLQRNLKGQAADAYIETVKEQRGSITVAQMLEGMTDVYLGNHPDIAKKFQRKEISVSALAEQMLDHLFNTALEENDDPERKSRIQNVISRLKDLTADQE